MFLIIVLVLAGSVLPTEAHKHKYKDCEYNDLTTCNQEFMDSFTNAPQGSDDMSAYCAGFQRYGNCLAISRDSCKGEFIDLDRFMILQHMLMDTKLGICNHDVIALTAAVNENKKYRKKVTDLLGVYGVESDDIDDCAEKIHKDCSTKMANDLRTDKMCVGVQKFVDCYDNPVEKCKSKIYKDFHKITNKVAKELIKMFKTKKNVMPDCGED